jgi:hypothetical protein
MLNNYSAWNSCLRCSGSHTLTRKTKMEMSLTNQISLHSPKQTSTHSCTLVAARFRASLTSMLRLALASTSFGRSGTRPPMACAQYVWRRAPTTKTSMSSTRLTAPALKRLVAPSHAAATPDPARARNLSCRLDSPATIASFSLSSTQRLAASSTCAQTSGFCAITSLTALASA